MPWAFDFDFEDKGRAWQMITWAKQDKEESTKVALGREDALWRSKLIGGFNVNAHRLR